jgi:hypothetical protein
VRCLQAERYADALGIAALPGAAPELFIRAQKAYMVAAPRPYMLLARCIMDQDFRGVYTVLYFRIRIVSASSALLHTSAISLRMHTYLSMLSLYHEASSFDLLCSRAALIGAEPLTSWKETLATLATYATNDTWQGLAQGLAERLAQHHRSASGISITGTSRHWSPCMCRACTRG